jgi:hypothetical protein
MPQAMVTPPGVLISAAGVVAALILCNVLCASWRRVSMMPFIVRVLSSPVQNAVTTPAAAFCSVTTLRVQLCF